MADAADDAQAAPVPDPENGHPPWVVPFWVVLALAAAFLLGFGCGFSVMGWLVFAGSGGRLGPD